MNFYLFFKSLHLIAVISWMAGLLYLSRIFVYHCESNQESQRNVFKTMARKLYNYIMMPAMLLSWLFGILKSCGFVPSNGTVPTVVHVVALGDSCITNSVDDPDDRLICLRSANTAVVFSTGVAVRS